MNIPEAVSDYFKSKAKKVPGLAYVATVISGIAAITLNRPEHDFHLLEVWVIWFVAFLFYFFSGILDDIVFDPLYGIQDPDREDWKRKWPPDARVIFLPIQWIVNLLPRTKKLTGIRRDAADKLNPDNYLSKGIYKSAEMFISKSEEWKDKYIVKIWLDLSKAARAFVIPLFILLLLDVSQEWIGVPKIKTFLNHHILNWFGLWYIALISLLVLLILYVWFRLLHMVKLYDLIDKSKLHTFFDSRVKVKNSTMKMLRIGSVIIPTSELDVYKKAEAREIGVTH